jgi:putative copper export protein
MTARMDRLGAGLLWSLIIALNGILAVYGGAWLAKLLAVQPLIGAALGLGNLACALLIRAKEKPNIGQRVQAAMRNRSPYSSVLVLLVVFSLAEVVAYFIAASALHRLQGGF